VISERITCRPDQASIASGICPSDGAANASTRCHPDEASNASRWKDLGQLRASEAGSGFEIAQRSFADGVAEAES
jgi:hypothetical protein